MSRKVTCWRSFCASSTSWRWTVNGTCFRILHLHGDGVTLQDRVWALSLVVRERWMETSLRHTLGVPQSLLGHVQRGFGRQLCHRPSWRGMLWHQARKKRKTTNAIYVTDRQRMPLAMSTPISGSHNDLYNISEVLRELFSELKASGLSVSSLFLNVDAGFDSVEFWRICHQQEVFPNVAFNKRRGM